MLKNIVSSVSGRVVCAVVIRRVLLSAVFLTMLAAAAYGQLAFRHVGNLGANSVEGEAFRLAQGDINNDGLNDYAYTIGSFARHKVFIRLGNGSGVTIGTTLVSEGDKGDVKFADLDRDGKLDILYTGFADGTLRTRRGNGDGTFAAEVIVGVVAAPVNNIFELDLLEIGDVNGDGFIDAVTATRNSSLYVSFGRGDGTFSGFTATDNLGGVASLAVLDIDGDGGADVVCMPRYANLDLVTFTGFRTGVPTIDGTELVPGGLPPGSYLAVAPSPNGIVFAAVEAAVHGRIVVGRNPGGNPTDLTVLPGTYTGLQGPGIADFDGDGIPDLAVVDFPVRSVDFATALILKGLPSGAPFGSVIASFETNHATQISPANYNHDGRLDVIMTGYYEQNPYFFFSVFVNPLPSLVVTTAADEDNGNAVAANGTGISLREAINYAQQLNGPQTISFAPNLGNTVSILYLDSDLTVGRTASNDPITIENNFGTVFLSGRSTRRVLSVAPNGKLNLRNLMIADGFNEISGGAGLLIGGGATVNVENCTFSNNISNGSGGSAIRADAGSNVTVCNSTFNSNIGKGTIGSMGNLTLEHVTVSGNFGSAVGGILMTNPSSGTANLLLRNSVIAANYNGSADLSTGGANVSGTNNILSPGANGNNLANTIFADPRLDNPASNGGRTRTMKPQPGSPTINTGAAIGITTDQRGISRTAYGAPDIGAFEANAFTPILNHPLLFAPNNTNALAIILNQVFNPTPAGGTFSGSGVSNNFFNPAGLTPGDKTITYTIAPLQNYEITNTATANITVFGLPAVTTNPAGQTVNQGDVASFSALATGIYAGNAPNSMSSGATLLPGQFLLSDNRGFQLVYQGDGNLVLYRANGGPLWASNTATNAPGFVAMQGDGNFVIYNSSGQAQFSTNTAGHPGARLLVQGDGNLVIYSAANAPIFATDTTISGTNPTTSMQWQVSTNGGANYSDISGANNLTLNISNVTAADDNKRFRAVFTNAAGSVPTDAARLSVTARATTTAITSESVDPTLSGQTFTVFYHVEFSGSGVPTGNVTVSDGVDSCTATATAGLCSLALTTAGNRILTATYAGDANFSGSVSAGEPHTVTAPLTLVVDTTSDDGGLNACTTATNDCSLRGAISRANDNPANDTINFDSGVFAVARTITLTNGQLTVANNGTVTINGTRADRLNVSGNNASRVFEVASGANLSLLKMTVSGGREVFGGGINNHGTLAINTVTVTGNTATGSGGGINSDTGTVTDISNSAITNNTSANNAGGLYFYYAATVNVFNTTVSNNSAGNFGGGITNEFSTIQMTNATVTNNTGAFGGGVYNFNGGTIFARNDLIAGNTAPTASDFSGTLSAQGFNLIGSTSGATITGDMTGNLLNVDAKLLPLSNYGGETPTVALLPDSPAINAGTADNVPNIDQRGRSRVGATDIGAYEAAANLVVTNTAISGTGSLPAAFAAANGSAADESITFAIPSNDSGCVNGICTINLNGGLAVNETTGGLIVSNQTAAANLVISANGQGRVLTSNGGNLAINGLTLTGGQVGTNGRGGGIYSSGSLVVMNSTITGNAGNSGSQGGGIYNENGLLTILNTTISNNTTSTGGNSTFGGAIFNNNGPLTISDSTISGNSARFGGAICNTLPGGVGNLTNVTISGNSALRGGGIYNVNNARINAVNVTITGNSAFDAPPNIGDGGGVLGDNSPVTIRNTIIAGNSSSNASDVRGPLTSRGYNLIGRLNSQSDPISGDQTGNIIGTNASPIDPKLAPLGFYGGKTMTHALLSGSPAINAGNSVGSSLLDQRGASRIGNTDIGAFELNSSQNGGNYVAQLPRGSVGINYSQTIVPDTGSTVYCVSSGTLPNGLSGIANCVAPLDQRKANFVTAPNAVLTISGTPTQGGTFNFAISATNGANTNVTNYTLNILAPTAAAVSIAGRVLTADGRGLQNAVVTMTDTNGNTRSARTASFGYYRFENIGAGQTYTIEVRSKRYTFAPQVVSVSEDLTAVNFTPQ